MHIGQVTWMQDILYLTVFSVLNLSSSWRMIVIAVQVWTKICHNEVHRGAIQIFQKSVNPSLKDFSVVLTTISNLIFDMVFVFISVLLVSSVAFVRWLWCSSNSKANHQRAGNCHLSSSVWGDCWCGVASDWYCLYLTIVFSDHLEFPTHGFRWYLWRA